MFVHLALQRILVFSWIAVTLSRTQSNWSEINVVEDYYSTCPYNNFCAKNATYIRNSNEMHLTSCCQECSCDPDCQKFGICCPDFTLDASIDIEYPCVDLDYFFNTPRGIQVAYFGLKYHIIDDCRKPVSYRTRYENSTLLEDFIVVTDVKTGRIYKNKHCALCHGVEEYEKWEIFTVCEAIDELSFDTFEERDKFIVKYCPIIPYPPPSQVTSLYRCIQLHPRYGLIERCHHIDFTLGVDEGLVNACEMHSPYTNDKVRVGDRWFKNIHCFWCNNKLPTGYSYLCEKPKIEETKLTIVSITMLLSTEERRSSKKPERCNESSILDPYMDKCLQLYCPPGSIPSFGKCSSVSDISEGVHIAMVYLVEFNASVEDYKYQLLQNFQTIMESKIGDKLSCEKRIVFLGKASTDVYLIYAVVTRGDCNRDFVMTHMWKLFIDSITFKVVKLNTTIETKLTASIESHAVVKQFSYPNDKFMFAIHNVLSSCARIDRRTVPMLTRKNLDTVFHGNIFDNKVCVRDYFEYAELTTNAMNTLKPYFNVLIFNILLFYGLR